MYTLMACEYNNIGARRLGFRADEAARTRLEDIQHAVEVWCEAAEHCDAREMRSEAVDAALDYLSSIAALLAFGRGLAIAHPQQRREAVQAALRSIQRALAPRS